MNRRRGSRFAQGKAAWGVALLCAGAIAGAPQRGYGQDVIPLAPTQNQNATQTATVATVHGTVVDATTGDPLPRALVRLANGEEAGALTDGEGRYEIAGVPTGPQLFEVLKPGFLDELAEAFASNHSNSMREYAHSVMVAAEMPDVMFKMEPANAIHGRVRLSTGETAQGVNITLVKQTIELGRNAWQTTGYTKTDADGGYRFGGLANGVYAIYNEPAMESAASTNLVEPGSVRNVQRSGYASLFYPEAHDLAGAAKIALHGGMQTEANLSLTLEPFYAVSATTGARGAEAEPSSPFGAMYSATVTDGQGHQLPYTARYDQATHTVQAFLPDGSYMFVVNGGRPMRMFSEGDGRKRMMSPPENGQVAGEVEFSVSGHAVSGLRVSLAPVQRSTVQINLIRSDAAKAPQSSGANGEHAVFIMLSKTGGRFGDGMMTMFASGTLESQVETTFAEPDTYWAHANLSDRHVCESSLTVGGTNLAREPLAVGLTGLGAPLTLNLRDDCARLTLTLPGTAMGLGIGEQPFYTVYTVPDFDTTEDIVPQTLRASTGGKITLEGLTPGSYHVYVFDKPVGLAYRERAALDALPQSGQSIELSPGSSANLVVEVPNHE